MKNKFLLSSAIALTLFSFFSCTKEDTLELTDNSSVIASASIDIINELDINTGIEISFDESNSNETAKRAKNSCPTITTVNDAFPKTFNVDFGTGCTINNIIRKGKLKITFSNYVNESGSTMTIERENYYVNGNKVEGKIEYKNITMNATTPQWTRKVTNGIFTDTKGEVYSNTGFYTIKQTTGVETLQLNDNTYEMTEGTHTVTKQNGGTITLTVSETLVKKFDCDYISKGKLNVETTLLNGKIDYGNGDCDNNATYTQNGIIFPFTM